MARRSKSDNAALGIFYLICSPFLIVYGIICGIIWLIGKIILLFKSTQFKTYENEPVHQKIELDKNIGITEPYCPYCGEELKKFPGRKTKCPNCQQYIYVRTRPADDKRILIREDEIDKIEEEKSKKYGSNPLVIDVSVEMNRTLKFLKENYEEFLTYPEIQEINADDRLPLMQYIWQHWDVRLDFKKLYEKYPHYSQELLDRIEKVESARCHMYFKKYEFISDYDCNLKSLVKICPVGRSRDDIYFCMLKDLPFVFEYYIKDTADYEFSHFPNYIPWFSSFPDDKNIYFFSDDRYRKISKDTLIRLCKDAGVKL